MKKTLKHSIAVLVALAMMLVMAIPAFAQTASPTAGAQGNATITVENAAKGETYKVVKLFDATYDSTTNAIAYTGTVPTELSAYFEKQANDSIIAKVDTFNKDAVAAMKAWADDQTAVATAVSDGTTLVFEKLAYGYYIVTTTQGAPVAVNSTMPNAVVYDKTAAYPSGLAKTANGTDYFIGDTITYTVSFKATNFDGAGEDAERIATYTITDTLPSFLSDVTVTSIVVDEDGNLETTNDQTAITGKAFDASKKIDLDWATNIGTEEKPVYESIYKNNSTIYVTYTAVLTDVATIDGAGNTNTVTLTWTDVDGDTHSTIPDPDPEDPNDPGTITVTDSATVYTYAVALKKVSDQGTNLEGATFQLPFYVKTTKAADGAYIYAGTQAAEGLTNSLTTPENGEITIKGVKAGSYSFTETAAPNGYNKLNAPVEITAVKIGETATTTTKTVYLDEDGDPIDEAEATAETTTVTYQNDNFAATAVVVVNKAGSILPSTGGIGTAIVIVAGLGIVAVGVIMMSRKKKEEN